MLVYLSKKIAIPNDAKLRCIGWHMGKGWIACGGENGLLKVLKLEAQEGKDVKAKGLAAPSNLSMNQSLEGHNGDIHVVAWNEEHSKLTSSDQNGLIIVWFLYKGMWYEEMINNRNKSIVRSIQWNKEGQKICIAYDDGAVIVGSVDGSRLWGKDIKGIQLTHVEWSPDGKVLIFGNSKGEIHIYDSHGTYNSKMTIQCLTNATGAVKIVGVTWYKGKLGYIEPNCPCLAIAYDIGRAQIMRHELDTNPVKIDSGMLVTCIAWNNTGSLLAMGGSQKASGADKDVSVVQFYTPHGEHLHTLRVPGKPLSSLSWEGGGLRIALAISSFIYFANIRHDYLWGYFSNTVVYTFQKPDHVEHFVIFWNLVSNEKFPKMVKNLVLIASCKDFCVLITRVGDGSGQYSLLLCNALGTPIDCKYIELEPCFVSMSHTHVIVTSQTGIFVWHYRTMSRLAAPELMSHLMSRKSTEGQERLIHVDDHPTGNSEIPVDFKKAHVKTGDPICCVCNSEKAMVVGRASGTVQYYSLPKLALEQVFSLKCRPHKIALNSNSTMLSVIDINGVLNLFNVEKKNKDGSVGCIELLDRKDVWDLKWAEDNPDLFAMMEKTRMYIFRKLDPEEPVVVSGHICYFNDMEVKSVLLDEIMKDPENPSEELIAHMEIKSLRDTRSLLQTVGITDAHQFIEDNPHPRLWRLLAEFSLEHLDLEMAEKAFVRCSDYQGIQFVKRLKVLESSAKQSAEVAAYFKRFEDAERIYLEMDRRDLAVDLRVKLGDWFKVVQLLKTGGGAGDDTILIQAWNAIGDYYADRQKWQHAVTYYTQGKNQERLAECYYILEDYDGLEKLASSLPENHPLLHSLAKMFVTVGMCEQAVHCYVKVGKMKDAINCCVELNQWDQAVDLAKKHNIKEIDSLLAKYATYLLEKDKILSAVELYHKANHFIEAAKLLIKVARAASEQSLNPMKIKKIYVLSALLVDKFRSVLKDGHEAEKQADHSKEDMLLSTESSILDNPWRGAEAYHFFLMAQRYLYTGKIESALTTTLVLREYEGVLPLVDIYSLLALCSCAASTYSLCSKALIKLESSKELGEEQRLLYDQLSLQIFTRHPPKDKVSGHIICPSCGAEISDWSFACTTCNMKFPICVATGQPQLSSQLWICLVCKHRANTVDMKSFKNCPLCHTPKP